LWESEREAAPRSLCRRCPPAPRTPPLPLHSQTRATRRASTSPPRSISPSSSCGGSVRAHDLAHSRAPALETTTTAAVEAVEDPAPRARPPPRPSPRSARDMKVRPVSSSSSRMSRSNSTSSEPLDSGYIEMEGVITHSFVVRRQATTPRPLFSSKKSLDICMKY
jgi:hypothetical protein